MTIRFAAAHSTDSSALVRALTARRPLDAANDNATGAATGSDRLLKAALRHFARHGLSAAELARGNAEEAFLAGKSEEYRWWLAICSALDRRMAAAVTFHCGQTPGANRSSDDMAQALRNARASPGKRANDAS